MYTQCSIHSLSGLYTNIIQPNREHTHANLKQRHGGHIHWSVQAEWKYTNQFSGGIPLLGPVNWFTTSQWCTGESEGDLPVIGWMQLTDCLGLWIMISLVQPQCTLYRYTLVRMVHMQHCWRSYTHTEAMTVEYEYTCTLYLGLFYHWWWWTWYAHSLGGIPITFYTHYSRITSTSLPIVYTIPGVHVHHYRAWYTHASLYNICTQVTQKNIHIH